MRLLDHLYSAIARRNSISSVCLPARNVAGGSELGVGVAEIMAGFLAGSRATPLDARPTQAARSVWGGIGSLSARVQGSRVELQSGDRSGGESPGSRDRGGGSLPSARRSRISGTSAAPSARRKHPA